MARYDEAIRIIDSNSALLDRKRPELEAKRERRAGLAETVASAAAEKETQQVSFVAFWDKQKIPPLRANHRVMLLLVELHSKGKCNGEGAKTYSSSL